MSVSINLGGESVELLPEKAIFWPAMEMLIAADLHLGKAATFRKLGVGIPEGNMEEDLNLLEICVKKRNAKRCLILGDLVHSGDGLTPYVLDQISKWVKRLHCPLYLTLGNHDKSLKAEKLAEWGIAASGDPLVIPPFAFCHHPPDETPDRFTMAGHIHPQVVLKQGPDRVRLPCFHVKDQVVILPAFGSFTGGHTISWTSNDRVFATTGTSLIEI